MKLVTLDSRHETALRPWLAGFLRQQIRWWSGAYSLDWTEDDISARIEAGEMLQREWTRMLGVAGSETDFVRVAEEGLAPRGIVHAMLREDRYLGVSIGTLCWVYVDASERGRGFGKALHQSALDWMREAGVAGSDLYVTAQNEAAAELYRRLGYHVVDYRMLAPLAAKTTT